MNDDDSSPAVELRGISKRFGPRVILERIDLAIGRGEVLVLVGPSGSGKSTLLKIVSGIETPDTGRVLLDGRDVTDQPPYRRAVHTVFQNYALFPHLDAAGNVAFPLNVAGVPRAQRKQLVETALGWVRMEQHAHRRVDTLSGGERQRIALARALVDQPACVLLDEPLSALDPHLRADTLDLLQGIQERLKTTFLFITHDREEALRCGHRIGVLNQGRLEQIGSPEEVYRQPRTAFVASFLGRINWLMGDVLQRNGEQTIAIAGQCGPLARSETLSIHGRVKIGIRPEDVQINQGGGLDARVTARTFLGDCVVVRVMLADGTTLIAEQRAPLSTAAVGDNVRIGWEGDAAHFFPPDGSEAEA